MAKMEFRIFGGGDPSVGIPCADASVIIEDNSRWDAEWLEDVREHLASLYDVPKSAVKTKAEWIDSQMAEIKQMGIEWGMTKIMEAHEEDRRLLFVAREAEWAMKMITHNAPDDVLSDQLTRVRKKMRTWRSETAKSIRETITYYQELVKERAELEEA